MIFSVKPNLTNDNEHNVLSKFGSLHEEEFASSHWPLWGKPTNKGLFQWIYCHIYPNACPLRTRNLNSVTDQRWRRFYFRSVTASRRRILHNAQISGHLSTIRMFSFSSTSWNVNVLNCGHSLLKAEPVQQSMNWRLFGHPEKMFPHFSFRWGVVEDGAKCGAPHMFSMVMSVKHSGSAPVRIFQLKSSGGGNVAPVESPFYAKKKLKLQFRSTSSSFSVVCYDRCNFWCDRIAMTERILSTQ